ncbi:uncharacterized protein DS421_1g17350 [Arachis hypogaea]|nr:uncharacterized protein DS421_1g17350 [Arachis hypogaea]
MDMLWDGRIRTSEWRDQNPMPYRLATPHFFYSTFINTINGISCSSIPSQKSDCCWEFNIHIDIE